DRGKPKAREIDACHTQDPGQHERRAEAGRHREESAKALALAGLFASVPPGHERVETREERGAERGRDDDTGRHRIRRDRIEAERCATESRDEQPRYDEALNATREISGDARD